MQNHASSPCTMATRGFLKIFFYSFFVSISIDGELMFQYTNMLGLAGGGKCSHFKRAQILKTRSSTFSTKNFCFVNFLYQQVFGCHICNVFTQEGKDRLTNKTGLDINGCPLAWGK